jgi:ABC-type transport system involved in cytochrome bd biosynthesis fused ATPase/permease subunit
VVIISHRRVGIGSTDQIIALENGHMINPGCKLTLLMPGGEEVVTINTFIGV